MSLCFDGTGEGRERKNFMGVDGKKKKSQEVLKRCSNPGRLGSSLFVIAVLVVGSSSIALGVVDRDLVYTSTVFGMDGQILVPIRIPWSR